MRASSVLADRPGHDQPDADFVTIPRAKVPDIIAMGERAGAGHYTPLLRAMGEGAITLAFAPRGADEIDLARFRRAGLPTVLVIQDDDHAATGPAGFPIARKALRFAKAHIIHGAAGEPWHYAGAGILALQHGSCALVETSAAWVDAWADLARRAAAPRRAPGFIVLARDGVHPITGRAH